MNASERSNLETILVIIAAFNEEREVGTVVSSVRDRGYEVVVVDDGSSDATSEMALSAGAVVVQHPVNLGQGAALQTGIEYGLRKGYSMLVTFDADGQHDPDDIKALSDCMAVSGADVVLGSRFLGSTIGMTGVRRILLKAAVSFTRLTTGLSLTDAHNGLRLLNRKAASVIHLKQNRMAHASEILEQIASSRLSYMECPVTIRYTDYSKAKGQSGLNSVNIVLDLVLQRLRK